MKHQWSAGQISDTQLSMNSFDIWIQLFNEFFYITHLSYTKQSHLKKGVLWNFFKQTWCTSRNFGTSEEISSTPDDLFGVNSKLPHFFRTGNTIEKMSLIKILVTDIKSFPDNIISHRQFWTKWWSLKFTSCFEFKFCYTEFASFGQLH